MVGLFFVSFFSAVLFPAAGMLAGGQFSKGAHDGAYSPPPQQDVTTIQKTQPDLA